MKKETNPMDDHYDFTGPSVVRGKYHEEYHAWKRRQIVLDKDVAECFPDSKSVNETLRAIMTSVPESDAVEALTKIVRSLIRENAKRLTTSRPSTATTSETKANEG